MGRRLAGPPPGPTRPPFYSYYGEYQYPVPFGYGYAYAPTRSHGFEYGYYGPRYAWSDPDWHDGPRLQPSRMVSGNRFAETVRPGALCAEVWIPVRRKRAR